MIARRLLPVNVVVFCVVLRAFDGADLRDIYRRQMSRKSASSFALSATHNCVTFAASKCHDFLRRYHCLLPLAMT